MKSKKLSYNKILILFCIIAVSVLMTGCDGDDEPIVLFFFALPITINQGESSTLTWSVSDADTVTITPIGTVASSGSTSVSPAVTTVYTLTATNSTGSVTATTTVTVSSAATVTYNGNGNTAGTVPVDPSGPYEYGATVTVLNKGDLVKTGYTFAGWNTKADGSGTDQAEGSTFIMGASDVTLFAKWTTNTYTVTFDSQGGSAVDPQKVDHGWLATEPTKPTRTGYTFFGWYKESGCTNVWDFDDKVISDVTLYAKWTINTYTVTFHKNGGDTEADPKTKTATYGGNVGTLPTAPSRTGYTFTSWNTKANGSGTEFKASTAVTANITVYAQWTPLYALRDTGPAGGKIFYVKEGGYSDGWMYLEADNVDQSTGAPWGCYGTSIPGANGTAVGTGKQNTIDIEAGCTTVGTAADICAKLILGGRRDWFLPSKEELNLMYTNLKVHGVGGFTGYYYWSSSEYDAYSAWGKYFSTGYQVNGLKSYYSRVRAVRAF